MRRMRWRWRCATSRRIRHECDLGFRRRRGDRVGAARGDGRAGGMGVKRRLAWLASKRAMSGMLNENSAKHCVSNHTNCVLLCCFLCAPPTFVSGATAADLVERRLLAAAHARLLLRRWRSLRSGAYLKRARRSSSRLSWRRIRIRRRMKSGSSTKIRRSCRLR